MIIFPNQGVKSILCWMIVYDVRRMALAHSHFRSQMHVVQFEGLAISGPMYDILSKGTPNFPIPNEHVILQNTPRFSAC